MAPKVQKRANNPVSERGEPSKGPSFPIVGVGASAGGLVAFTELLTHLPFDTGMGFVLVQHLDPEHESALTQLLARATKMPVREITNNQRVEANCVYVMPPNTNLGIARGVLKLQPRPETRTPHRSIDFFFESLAEDQRERSIGVILSGTATDGTLGLTAIKAEGGITFAQDDSARYDSMPRSAVAVGCVEPSVQKKALRTFHYALKPKGFLFLGASESIGAFTDLFEPVDKKHKIYSRKAATTPRLHLESKRGEPPAPDQRPLVPFPKGQGEAPVGFRAGLDAQREADRITVNRFAPPGVLIDAELQIVQFRGSTGAYLEPPAGKASFEVLKMARQGLMLPLRAAINQAKKENKTVRRENVRVNDKTVNVEVIPLKNLRERCFLIVFEDAGQAGDAADRAPLPTPRPARKESRRVAELERENSEMRDYLQSIQEQYEAANEELQASSEELQSANEELQSINEELETSKEELESANEELTTVNEEMANRNAELNRLNNDLVNLQTSAKLAVVLVGRDLAIRRFSP